MLQLGGGFFTPPPTRCTFYPVALKPIRIVTKAFVTFPEYSWAAWAKKMLNKIQIYPLVFPIWRLENEQPTKMLENSMLRGYLVSKAHKNKIPCFQG